MIGPNDLELIRPLCGGRRHILCPNWSSLRGVAAWVSREKPLPNHIRVLDVGACIGAFTMEVLRVAENAEIDAFEPSDMAWPYLQYNLSWSNVRLHNVACSDKDGVAMLACPDKRIGTETLHGKDGRPVRTVTIDGFISGKVDIIKIDVEGHEVEVLKGAERTIDRWHPNLIVELVDKNQALSGRRVEDVVNVIARHGYRNSQQITINDWIFT